MALFELGADKLISIEPTTFATAKVKERADLQRLLRMQIDAIVPDRMVLSEEFGNWDDSNRRIDLLVLDKDANLVIVELKRTEDGGHMELQAIRYAAMISMMTWEKAVDAHREFLEARQINEDAEDRMLKFLDWEEPSEEQFANDVRIVLASADFSKELTTAVLWLNDRGLDIRCVRLKPYSHGDKTLIDIQQIIPLPEAQEYQVRVREKESQEREARQANSQRHELNRKFWTQLLSKANKVLEIHKNISPSKESWLNAMSGGIQFGYTILKDRGRIEVKMNRSSKEENKAIFDEIIAHRDKIETQFGSPLNWLRYDEGCTSYICVDVTGGGISDEATWDELQNKMIDKMRDLTKALDPYIRKYREGASPKLPDATPPA